MIISYRIILSKASLKNSLQYILDPTNILLNKHFLRLVRYVNRFSRELPKIQNKI